MRRRLLLAPILAGALVLVGCGGGGSDPTPPPGPGGAAAQANGDDGMGHTHPGDASGTADCSVTPAVSALKVTVKDIAFNTSCLAVPANAAFTLTFDNQDQIVHNIVFLESATAAVPLYRLDLTQGPKVVSAQAGPFPAGTYLFHCEVHPAQMFGTFVVK